MSVGEYIITPFTDTDFNRLVELSLTTYPGREISDPVYLEWEYLNNPHGQAIINVAINENKVVAQYLVLPREYSIDNKILKGSLSANTLTHPDFRGLNLFSQLAGNTFSDCRKKEILFTIGFPNPLSLPVIITKKIFDVSGYLPLLVKPLSPLKTLLKYISGKKNKTGDEIIVQIPAKDKFVTSNVSLFDIDEDENQYEKFVGNFNKRHQNVTHRSLSYLRWRFLNIPIRKYHILKYKTGEEIKAIAVVRTRFMYGVRTLILIDLFSVDSQGTANLLKEINGIAKLNSMELIISTVPSHSPEFEIFKKSGYFSVPQFLLPQKLALIVRRHNRLCPEQVSDFRRWFLTFGDYDIF